MSRAETPGKRPTFTTISDSANQLHLTCTNCGVQFATSIELTLEAFESAPIEDAAYQCPVCARFDTYGKDAVFYVAST